MDEDDGAILGLMHACFLARDAGRRAARGSGPLAEKESRRWLDGAGRAAEVGAKAARVTVIADRESDIFAAFALRPAATELVVRAAQVPRSIASLSVWASIFSKIFKCSGRSLLCQRGSWHEQAERPFH